MIIGSTTYGDFDVLGEEGQRKYFLQCMSNKYYDAKVINVNLLKQSLNGSQQKGFYTYN